ncbi:PREDICTED: colorectal mutant cancer protein [Dipodomys ordii]|uniref:Colorectal mutant cancer protein n=1 Tax=Dipodomys ordii TaxID=10020 RepID=A0A1S3F5E1_DIPOR|nr:PREDICTED: colorectal mutant cancer protein [Dipodomys ordii]
MREHEDAQERTALRYEERVTELHSIIAELNKKIDRLQSATIREEDEYSELRSELSHSQHEVNEDSRSLDQDQTSASIPENQSTMATADVDNCSDLNSELQRVLTGLESVVCGRKRSSCSLSVADVDRHIERLTTASEHCDLAIKRLHLPRASPPPGPMSPLTCQPRWFQVRELQTRLQSVQATGPSSPGRLTAAARPVNPSTGELSTSSSSNDIPIAKIAERVKLSKTRSESSSSDRPVLGSEISSVGVSSSVAEHLAHSLQDCSNIQEIFQTLYSHGSAISESKIREFEVETERLNSNLVAAYEKAKKKHQNKLKKLESQMMAMVERHETQLPEPTGQGSRFAGTGVVSGALYWTRGAHDRSAQKLTQAHSTHPEQQNGKLAPPCPGRGLKSSSPPSPLHSVPITAIAPPAHLSPWASNPEARVRFRLSEQCIEAYELLLALAESEQSLILGQFRAAGVGSSPGDASGGESVTHMLQRAHDRRKSAENATKALLAKLDGSCAGAFAVPGCSGQPWESLSSNSHTSTTSSTASSCDTEFTKEDEQRLKDYIQQLKSERAAVKLTMLELESIHIDPLSYDVKPRGDSQRLDLENAVLMQELMAMKEAMAGLKSVGRFVAAARLLRLPVLPPLVTGRSFGEQLLTVAEFGSTTPGFKKHKSDEKVVWA